MHCILKLFVLVCALFVAVKSDRKVTAKFNPGCNQITCENVIFFHVKAEGQDDTLHHFWDFTGKPTLTLVLTETNASVTFNWQRINYGQDKGITIDSPIKYVYGLVVDKVIEFNDEYDTGSFNETITNSSYVTVMDTRNMDWKVVKQLDNSSGDASVTVEASGYVDSETKQRVKNGTIRFVVSAFGGEDQAVSLPHLLHSGNASQIDVTLDGLNTAYKKSRFGLHLISASSERTNKSVDLTPRKTMDDEHAPGVFTIVEMRTPNVREGGNGGYLQWRPVVYTSPAREMTVSIDCVQYSVSSVEDPISSLNYTLLYSLLGNNVADMLVASTYVTFGSAEDEFYSKNRYASWTMLAGYGHPPEESFSMLVTLVLIIGLGLPAVLILVGTVCIIVRRLNRNRDDMFLAQ